MMRKRRLLCLGVALVALCGIRLAKDLPVGQTVLMGYLRHEPFYNGMPISYWVQQTKLKADLTPMSVQEDADESDGFFERGQAWRALQQMGPAGVQAMAGLLKDEKVIIRHQAALSLAQLGARSKPALPALMEAVERDGERFRTLAASDRAGRPKPGLKGDDANPAFIAMTRLRELEAIYRIDHAQLPVVISGLLDTLVYCDDEMVQSMAWQNLQGLDPQASIAAFIPAPEGDPAERQLAASKAAAVCRLREATAMYNSDRRRTAEVVLALGDALAHANTTWIREIAWQGMRASDPRAEVPAARLVASLKQEPNGDALAARANLAFQIRQAEAFYDLTRDRIATVNTLHDLLVRGEDEWLLGVIVSDLRRLDPEATVSLAPLAESLKRQGPDGARLAMRATEFGRLRRAEAALRADRKNAPAVLQTYLDVLLRGQDKWVRNTAWRTLLEMDPRGVILVPAFTKALQDPSPEVRKVADMALKRLDPDNASTATP